MAYLCRRAFGLSYSGNRALSKETDPAVNRPRDRLSWDDLLTFAVVAECGSLSKAAHLLKVTKAAVSRRLDDLEIALEARLLTRSQTGITLTAAGEDILDRALSMRRVAESIESAVRARDRKEEGMVTIAAPDGLSAYWLAPRLAKFLAENPKIQVTLNCSPFEDIGVKPDISITADKAKARVGDAIKSLASLHYVFVAAPSYIETYGAPQSLAGAAGDHRTLKHVAQTFQRETWGARASAIEALASFSVISNSSATIVAAVLAGAGIATVPSFFCHLYPELRIVGPETAIPIQLWSVSHQETMDSARVRRVMDWLESVFDTKTNPWFREEYISPSRFADELAAIDKRRAPTIQPAGSRRSK